MALLGPKIPVANPFSALAKNNAVPPVMGFSDGEEKHSLFVAPENGEVKLMVASTPQLLDTYLKAKKDTVKGTNEAPFNEIMQLVNIYNQVSSGFKYDLGKRLAQIMNDAVQEMISVGIGSGNDKFKFIPPATQVVWGSTVTDGKNVAGTSMAANPLSINPGGYAGSEPGSQYKKSAANYVKGHLLNHHLHGAAKDDNLTPMKGAMNTAFEKNFENFLKQKIISENKVFRYKVEAKNFYGVIPDLVEVEAVELKWDGTNWIDNTDGWSVSGTVEQSGDVTRSIRIGTTDHDDLMETGNDPGFLTDYLSDENTPVNAKLEELEAEYGRIQYEWSSEFGLYLKEVMEKIVLKLTTLFPETAAFFPKTLVEYGPTRKFKNSANTQSFHFADEHGTSMHAKLLSINPGNNHGYEPEEIRWGSLVQGHLLNHHLHGPASSENLLPISNSLNTQMEKDIENKAKKMVLEENKVVSYSVKAASDVTITESDILLGKDFNNFDSVPQTPNAVLQEYDEAYEEVDEILESEDINITDFKKRKFVKDSDDDIVQKRFKTAEDLLYRTHETNIERYEALNDYYVPSGIKAELQPLTLKNGIDASAEAQVDNPDNWKADGAGISFTGINSLEEKAK